MTFSLSYLCTCKITETLKTKKLPNFVTQSVMNGSCHNSSICHHVLQWSLMERTVQINQPGTVGHVQKGNELCQNGEAKMSADV